MALTKGQSYVDLSNKSLALLSIQIANQNKPSYQLHPSFVFIDGAMYKVASLGSGKLEGPYRSEKDSFNAYLLSFDLEPGSINFDTILIDYTGILLTASSSVPLDLKVDIKPNSVNYLGHIDAVLREIKSDDEKRAGLTPFIDAAVVGFSTGTFDLVVEDRYDDDMKSFISEYPGLQKVKVEKCILPQWIRPENRSAK